MPLVDRYTLPSHCSTVMKSAEIRFSIISLSFIFFSVFCIHCTGRQSFRDAAVRDLHLVIDAGSSGTRFCIYRMQFTSAPVNNCRIQEGECRPVPAENGLASLPPRKAEEVLRTGFASIPQSQKDRMVHVSLLGTGGFRRLSPSAQTASMNHLAGVILETGLPATVRVISGEEEALLAWRSIRAQTGSSTHAIIETGGATMQVASGTSGTVHQSISLPLGLNETRSRLKKETACFSSPSEDRFESCRQELMPLLADLKKFPVSMSPVYGLGNPYTAIFDQLKKDEIQRSDIEASGRRICSGEQEKNPMACYLFAFHAVQLELLKVNRIRKGTGSWPPGAALSPEFFPSCR